MTKFYWCIDSENYLSNKDKYADKLPTKDFIRYVAKSLNEYKDKYTLEQIKAKQLPHCHFCPDLERKKSAEARRLRKHLEEINKSLGERMCIALEIEQIFQFPIKNVPNKPEYRCFGYFLDNVFYLVYLDPNHDVYKE